MWKSAVAVIALSAGMLAAPVSAQAADDLCGWSGNVRPLMAKAERDFRKLDIPKLAAPYFGKGLKVVDSTMMEVDLAGEPTDTDPLKAVTLTSNRVAFNVMLRTRGGDDVGFSLLLTYDGMCYDEVITSTEAWTGSTGVGKKLLVGANRALALAQEYREQHPDSFPTDMPLVAMNLMQATTAGSDFGKLRWYVNYDNGAGDVAILTVYMDGTVKPR
jgi:hypothetical protein